MNTSTAINKRLLRCLTMVPLMVIALSASAFSQSTDRDNPTPLTANEVRGSGINKYVQYYYTFLAGPGEMVLTTDAAAKSGSTFFEVEVFDMDAVSIDVIRYGPTMTPERKVKRIQIAQQQPVLLRINLDPSAGNYMVRVGGAVQIETAATLSSTPVAADAGGAIPVASADPTAATGTSVTGESTPPVTADTTATTTDPASAAAAGGKVSKFQKLWMRIGAASELLGLSNVGKLKIDMKDGTSQEISLLKVKKFYAPKGDEPNSSTPMNDSWQRLWMKLGGAGELMNLAGTGAMRLELQDGTQQQFDLAKVKKVSLKK